MKIFAIIILVGCGHGDYHPCTVDEQYRESFDALATAVNAYSKADTLTVGGPGCYGSVKASDEKIAQINAEGKSEEGWAFWWAGDVYLPEPMNMDPDRRPGANIILAHEIGHALGLAHRQVQGDLMVPGEQWHCKGQEATCLVESLKAQGVSYTHE